MRATEPVWECQPWVDPDPCVVLSEGPVAVHVECDPETLDECLPRSGRVGFLSVLDERD